MPFARVLAGVRDGPGCVCALVLLLVLLALAPLANSSPSDPLWIEGVYDGADFDDAVAAVVSESAVVETSVLPARPADIAAGTERSPDKVFSAAPISSTFSIRAPP
jgi:hypothetical protein